jgi:hypothetical protein
MMSNSQDLWIKIFYAASGWPFSPGRSTSFPLMNVAPAGTSATRWGALTARQRSCADSMSFRAMAWPAARDAGAAQVHPVLGGVVVEREKLVQVTGDLRRSLRELRSVGGVERLRCLPGVLLVLGAPDLGQGLLRARAGGPGQRSQDIG